MNSPIGIFDSGIGGLTVAHAIRDILPNESLIYFGDTAHLPYGDKSPDSIRYYSLRISKFLLEKKCKAIVIACNSASSVAYDVVKEFFGDRVPVINVIDPVVKEVAENRDLKNIGVIGTKATVNSGVYAKRILALNPYVKVASLATPLLANMIEEGYFNNKISHTVIETYLSDPVLKGIDALILACTHYPLIKKEVAEFYDNHELIVDSAEIVARFLAGFLEKNDLLSGLTSPEHHFYVSDYTRSFEESTRIFFGKKVKLEEGHLWK